MKVTLEDAFSWSRATLLLLLLGLAALGTGCGATGGRDVSLNAPRVQVGETAGEIRDRSIETSDLLIIEVFGEQDFTVKRRVEAGGTINYPHLNDLQVAGKTTAEVDEILTERLGRYLVNPVVTVLVEKYRSRTVSVLGSVFKQGPVMLPEEQTMDLIEAIAFAGGFTPVANQNRILFTRKGVTTRLRYRDLRASEKKIWLEPGDVIEVKERLI